MTTGIEYTQCFTYVATGSGSTGFQYFELSSGQTSGTVYVIKYFSVSSTSEINNTSPDYAVQVRSATDNVGTGYLNVLTNNTAADVNIPVILLNNIAQQEVTNTANQIILTKNYIGINVNMLAPGTFTATVCYSVIPYASALQPNFGVLTESGLSVIPILNSGSSTRILKSAIVSNFDTTNTYTAQFVLYTSSTLSAYLTKQYTLLPGDSVCYSLPFYLTTSSLNALYCIQTLTPVSPTAFLSSYCSYIQEN